MFSLPPPLFLGAENIHHLSESGHPSPPTTDGRGGEGGPPAQQSHFPLFPSFPLLPIHRSTQFSFRRLLSLLQGRKWFSGCMGREREREGGGGADILALKHESRILGQWSNPEYWFKEVPSQFSIGQTAQSLTCSTMEKPHTGLDDCPRILLSCFRARNSGKEEGFLPRFLCPFNVYYTCGSVRVYPGLYLTYSAKNS